MGPWLQKGMRAMSRGFGYVIAKCLSTMLGAAVLAALLSGLVGWVAWEWVVPAHGLSAARAFVRKASVAIGLGFSAVAMVMLVRHLYGRSRRNRSDRGGINASVLDAVVPRMHRSGRQALCCLLAFLLTFSLLGDGVAAYADELRGDTGAPQAESDIQTPGADGSNRACPGRRMSPMRKHPPVRPRKTPPLRQNRIWGVTMFCRCLRGNSRRIPRHRQTREPRGRVCIRKKPPRKSPLSR